MSQNVRVRLLDSRQLPLTEYIGAEIIVNKVTADLNFKQDITFNYNGKPVTVEFIEVKFITGLSLFVRFPTRTIMNGDNVTITANDHPTGLAVYKLPDADNDWPEEFE